MRRVSECVPYRLAVFFGSQPLWAQADESVMRRPAETLQYPVRPEHFTPVDLGHSSRNTPDLSHKSLCIFSNRFTAYGHNTVKLSACCIVDGAMHYF